MIITPCITLCLISDDTKYNVSPVSHLEICGNTERIFRLQQNAATMNLKRTI